MDWLYNVKKYCGGATNINIISRHEMPESEDWMNPTNKQTLEKVTLDY